MDMNVVREIVTVASFLAFAGVVAYAMYPGNGKRFEEAARLPLDEDGYVPSPQPYPHPDPLPRERENRGEGANVGRGFEKLERS